MITTADRDKLLSWLPRVRLTVSMTADLTDDGEHDPALAHWRAAATLTLVEDEPSDPVWYRDDIALQRDDNDVALELTIAEIEGVLVDLARVDDAVDAVDGDSAESAHFIAIFDGDSPTGWDPNLDEELGPLGSRAVLIHRAEVASGWRGLGGVGRLLTARALRWVGGDARAYALKPFPLQMSGCGDDPAFDDAQRKVCAVWESLGFERWRDDIWILDASLRVLDDAVADLESNLGLA